MNTLPRAITARYLLDTNTYWNLRSHWSTLMRSPRKHELAAVHHLLYLALLGKDWRKGFTPITNRRKLDNGAFFGWKLFRAITALHLPSYESELLKPFDGLVTPEMLHDLRSLIPVQNAYAYQPAQFAPRSFPFDAYSLPASVPDGSQQSQEL